jgi:hypothetical protein
LVTLAAKRHRHPRESTGESSKDGSWTEVRKLYEKCTELGLETLEKKRERQDMTEKSISERFRHLGGHKKETEEQLRWQGNTNYSK